MSGSCGMPMKCNFDVASALGYVPAGWSHNMSDVLPGKTVLSVTIRVEGETVASFGTSKQALFRASVAAALSVDESLVTLTIKPADGFWRRLLSSGGIEIVVMVVSTEASVVEAAEAALHAPDFGETLSAQLEDRGVRLAGAVFVDASSINVVVEAPAGAPTVAPTAAPTQSPTLAPTSSPTLAPTLSPTTAPTALGATTAAIARDSSSDSSRGSSCDNSWDRQGQQ